MKFSKDAIKHAILSFSFILTFPLWPFTEQPFFLCHFTHKPLVYANLLMNPYFMPFHLQNFILRHFTYSKSNVCVLVIKHVNL